MRKKVSTIMEASLFRRAKLQAAKQGKPLSALIEEALEAYFANPSGQQRAHMTVDESWGAMAAPPELIRLIMEDDDEYFES